MKSRRIRSWAWGAVAAPLGALPFVALTLAACSSAGGSHDDPVIVGTGGSANGSNPGGPNGAGSTSGQGSSGSSGAPDVQGPDGLIGSGDFTPPPGGSGQGCQQAARDFTPKTPSVFVVVDRSSSMFNALDNSVNPPPTAWSRLRVGVLQVVQELQGSVNFGFGAFSGATSGADLPYRMPDPVDARSCLNMQPVAPALNNQASIAQLYQSLERPTLADGITMDSRQKETPTVLALNLAANELWNVPSDGDRFILFVTDGEPDYCDDPFNRCAVDSVIGRLQQLSAGTELDAQGAPRPPIRTLVFSITAPGTSILPAALQAFANAGAAQPVETLGVFSMVFGGCNGAVPWMADVTASGKPYVPDLTTVGTYAPLGGGGTAAFYKPDANDQTALLDQIRVALAEVKSCSFDLSGDGVKVDIARADLGEKAVINVNGARVPFDPANGWSMASETAVLLNGAACDTWRSPGETSIDFDFPCDVIILR